MPNATDLLREDHHKVKDLFQHFEEIESGDKQEIVAATLRELEIHTAVEEEIFYPAARKALEELDEEADVIAEAWEEHHVVKLLADELKRMRSGDERYGAKFTVLAESVKHHIKEEEDDLFPKLEGHLDEGKLGQKMMARKETLQQRAANGSRGGSENSKTRLAGSKRGKRKQSRSKKGRRAAGSRR